MYFRDVACLLFSLVTYVAIQRVGCFAEQVQLSERDWLSIVEIEALGGARSTEVKEQHILERC
jgi:hypothetical protein